MGTRVDYIFAEDLSAGAPSGISGATTEVKIIRHTDNYVMNSGGSFVDPSSGPTYPTMTEDTGIAGHYYYDLPTTTSWNDGYYARVCTMYKTGKTPYQVIDEFTVNNGVYSPATGPGSPTSLSYCRVYLYLYDIPSTTPTATVVYKSPPWNADSVADYTPTEVYNNTTGLWYVDLLRDAVCRITIDGYGVDKGFVVPDSAAVALPAI